MRGPGLARGDLNQALNARHARRVGHLQTRQSLWLEPAKIVVLLGRSIDGLAFPPGDEERVHLERWVAEVHGDGQRVVDSDAEFFEALTDDRLARQLAQLNMSPHKVPTVGIPRARWVAMGEEHTTVAHQASDRDPNLDDHDVTLCGHPHMPRIADRVEKSHHLSRRRRVGNIKKRGGACRTTTSQDDEAG